MGILPPTNEQIDNYFKGGATRLELLSAEREQSVDSMCSPKVSKWDTCHKPPFSKGGLEGM